jgi:hypothetical protein
MGKYSQGTSPVVDRSCSHVWMCNKPFSLCRNTCLPASNSPSCRELVPKAPILQVNSVIGGTIPVFFGFIVLSARIACLDPVFRPSSFPESTCLRLVGTLQCPYYYKPILIVAMLHFIFQSQTIQILECIYMWCQVRGSLL